MKAAVYHGVEEMHIERVATPEPAPGELLIKVEACGICGTDTRIYYQGRQGVEPPQILGHEISGTIVAVGSGVSSYGTGDRVNLTTEVTCGTCRFCLRARQNMCVDHKTLGLHYAGGFAEYMLVPSLAVSRGNVLKLPDSVSLKEAALIEPIACGVNAQGYLNMGVGDRVVVLGAGIMGCMMLALAKLSGASQTILVNARSRARLELAKRIGADFYVSAADGDPVGAVKEITEGRGADVVIVTANSAVAQQQAIDMAAIQGRVCLFAGLPTDVTEVSLNTGRIHYDEISVFGAHSSRRQDADVALDLIAGGKLHPGAFITHELPLDDLVRGIEMKQAGETIKTIVVPWASDGVANEPR